MAEIRIGNRTAGSSPDSLEFLGLLDDLFPEERGRLIIRQDFRLWLNEKTGLEVENGAIMGCIREWLPRLREMAAKPHGVRAEMAALIPLISGAAKRSVEEVIKSHNGGR